MSKPATYVVVVEGGHPNTAAIAEQIAASVARELRQTGFISDDQTVKVAPVRKANSTRKTAYDVELVTPSEVI